MRAFGKNEKVILTLRVRRFLNEKVVLTLRVRSFLTRSVRTTFLSRLSFFPNTLTTSL
jgi:hypothetical protein